MKNILFFILFIFIGTTQLTAQTGTRNNPMSLQNEEKVVVISPNPAINQITVNATKASGKINSIAIYSIIGNEVLNVRPESNNVILNVANLKKGKYIVKTFFSNGNSEVTTLIKN